MRFDRWCVLLLILLATVMPAYAAPRGGARDDVDDGDERDDGDDRESDDDEGELEPRRRLPELPCDLPARSAVRASSTDLPAHSAVRARGTDRAVASERAEPRAPCGVPNLAGPAVPTVDDVIAAAYAAAGLDHDPGRSWTRRARLSGLVPWVTVRTGRTTSWDDQEPDVGHGTTLEVRATWRLDRLAFDARELQVASIEAARRRERRRVATRVIRVYYTWVRANRVAVRDPRWALHEHEAAAELDAMTDGRFSRALHPGTAR